MYLSTDYKIALFGNIIITIRNNYIGRCTEFDDIEIVINHSKQINICIIIILNARCKIIQINRNTIIASVYFIASVFVQYLQQQNSFVNTLLIIHLVIRFFIK